MLAAAGALGQQGEVVDDSDDEEQHEENLVRNVVVLCSFPADKLVFYALKNLFFFPY